MSRLNWIVDAEHNIEAKPISIHSIKMLIQMNTNITCLICTCGIYQTKWMALSFLVSIFTIHSHPKILWFPFFDVNELNRTVQAQIEMNSSSGLKRKCIDAKKMTFLNFLYLSCWLFVSFVVVHFQFTNYNESNNFIANKAHAFHFRAP